MKKHHLFAVCLLCCTLFAQARVITVSNNAAHPTIYTTITAAIADANDGDSIYVLGSPTKYDAVTITKRVALFGPGFNPDKVQDPLTAIVPKFTLATPLASGSEINGFVIESGIMATADLEDIIITRNHIAGNIGNNTNVKYRYSNWTISNNFLPKGYILYANSSSYTVTVHNMLIENNVAMNVGYVMANTVGEGIVLFKNNIFIYNGGSTSNFTSACKNLMVEQNLILGFNGSGLSTDSYARNNLAYRAGSTLTNTYFPTGNPLTQDNILNQDPLFINLTDYKTATATSDFNLQPNSPAVIPDTDWKEMGVYGGNPASSWAFAYMPRLPYIKSFTLETTTVPARGTLKITIVSNKHD